MGLSLRPENKAVHLTDGLAASNIDEKYYEPPLMQVIPSACAACPPNKYIVTNMCRGCMAHPCMQICPKGAISMVNGQSVIDQEKCIKCGKCKSVCPYDAISHNIRPCEQACGVKAIGSDEQGRASILEDKCVSCGMCMVSCPFGAIDSKTFVVDVIKLIKAGKKVVAMVAPSVEGQFGPEITMASWKTALKKVGFADMVEVGLGGDMTAAYEADEWVEAYKEGKKMTTSCCPAFVNMIKKQFPMLLDNMSTTVSPMCAVSRLLKAMDPETITVFIGPCIAKKSEALDLNVKDNADYVLNLEEIYNMIQAKGVDLEPEPNDYQESSIFGKRFGNGGGVTNAVLQCFKEMGEDIEPKVARCSGGAECKKALLLLKVGRLPEDFIEGMVCVGGCVGGPSKHKTEMEAKKDRDSLIKQADDRKVLENLKNYPMDQFSMHRH